MMDSWTLQGDNYSFLHGTRRTFTLCHRDGTPNHVEIFDIINAPSQPSAISETTCLCDIFGDDCESSSPAVGACVPSQREAEGTAAASPLVDDLNDSSGSYHTAQGSSEGEEGFEDPTGRTQTPLLSQRSAEHLEHSMDSSCHVETNRKSPVPQLSGTTASSEAVKTIYGEGTPSLSPQRTESCSPSSSVETRHSPSIYNQRQTRTLPDRHNSPSTLSLSPSPWPMNCGSSCSSESLNTQLSPEVRGEGVSSKPKDGYLSQLSSPSPGAAFKDFPQNSISPTFKSSDNLLSPSPVSSYSELSAFSRETQLSQENQSDSLDIQASSPLTDRSGRVSLPDLFHRGSTPDIESPHSGGLTSDPDIAERNSTTTPENQDRGFSAASSGSPVSAPAPQYTPPSPVISHTPSPQLGENHISPAFKQVVPSSSQLDAASLAVHGSRTVSSGPLRPSSITSEGVQGFSPTASHTLSPSPEVQINCSPTESRQTAPSPEIRIIAASPDLSRREQSYDVETLSDTPPLDPRLEFDPTRSLTSSPHITGISYSVVQPEDRDTPPFPELYRPSTSQSDRTHASLEARSSTPSRASIQSSISDSTGHSPDESCFTSSVLQPEITLSHQSRYPTPSPEPKCLTPLLEPRYHSPSSEKSNQSPSPQPRSSESSPVAPSTEERNHQLSPLTLSTGNNTQPTFTPPNTTEVNRLSPAFHITERQYNTKLEPDHVSPSFQLNVKDKSAEAEIKSNSPEVGFQSHGSTSPLSEETEDISLKNLSTEDVTTKVRDICYISDSGPLSQDKQHRDPDFFHTEDSYSDPSFENKSLSPNLFSRKKERGQHIPPVHQATTSKSLQQLENQQAQFAHYPRPSGSTSSSQSSNISEDKSRQLSTRFGSENRSRFMRGMAHRGNRRTPSPPLTRFTPVHILPPEKPHRQWQIRAPPQVGASSQTGHIKRVVTNRESPDVVPTDDNNSQPQWVRLGKQLEMERKIQLEEERELQRPMDWQMERGKKKEGWALHKGEEYQGKDRYRGEQVELSINARNRKGSMSYSPAPTSTETSQRLPKVHSYSESLLATRQLQQQQGLPRLPSQQNTKGGGPGRRLQLPAPPNENCVRGVTNRPCRSSSSSMGSEFDDADNELKWFTDVAFSSLSSPEVDYLDMYNSSQHSSTNISQTSTQESPAGVSAAWLAYADFRGSAPKLDNDDLPFLQAPAYSGGLDPSRCYEMGSFECIDVAVREDSKKARRGVPKRQIQLKRKDSVEGKQDSSENSSPGVPAMMDSPSLERHSRDALLRQNSTPAAPQECCHPEHSDRKSKLQKSASLEESGSKTKMATCLIKNVLSKKMQSVDEQMGNEENSFQAAVPPFRKSPKLDTDHLGSSHYSDYSFPPEGFATKGEQITKEENNQSFGLKSRNLGSSGCSSKNIKFSQVANKEVNFQDRNATSVSSERSSECKVPTDNGRSRAGIQLTDDSKTWEEVKGGDSANATARNTGGPSATGDGSMHAIVTSTEEYKQLQKGEKSIHDSKTQEITLKGVEKKKASLKVNLTPEAEDKREVSSPNLSFREKEERAEADVDLKSEEDDRSDRDNKVKVPIHKVRDVRRLVKNMYNLSFKATSSTIPSDVNEESTGKLNVEPKTEIVEQKGEETIEELEEKQQGRKEEKKVELKDEKVSNISVTSQRKGKPQLHSQPMQIQYKAVCWNEGKNITRRGEDSKDPGDKPQPPPKPSNESSKTNVQTSVTVAAATTKPSQVDIKTEAETQETTSHGEDKPVKVRTNKKPPMLGCLPKLPSKEREVSTAVVLIRDASSKTKTSAAQEEVATPPDLKAIGETPSSSSHSVSMLLKEKGYHADIGAVVGDCHNAPVGKRVPHKHVNCLEIPLQTTLSSDSHTDFPRERAFSSSSSKSSPSAMPNTDKHTLPNTREKQGDLIMPDNVPNLSKQMEQGDFETMNRKDPTFPPSSPALRRARPQPVEIRSLSNEMPAKCIGNYKPQAIEIKSIAKNSEKPAVPPKPSCKFKPVDLGAMANESHQSSGPTSTVKPLGDGRSQTIVVSSPTIYRKLPNESTSASNYTRKIAVSAVSSLKALPSKITSTTISSLSNQSTTSSNKEMSNNSSQQQQPGAAPQNSRSTQRLTNVVSTPVSTAGPSGTSDADGVSDPSTNQVVDCPTPGDGQTNQPAVSDPNSQQQHPSSANFHEQDYNLLTTVNPRQPAASSTTHTTGYTHHQYCRSVSSERSQRTEDLHFYASDDPPSYDDRESFSPLALPDLNPRRSTGYQPSSRPPPCSCTAGCPTHPDLPPVHHHRSPHSLTPPAPPHSPGQVLPYAMTQASLRPHQCRADPQPISFQPSSSPKSSPLGPSQPPAIYQPFQQPPTCPPHSSLLPACPTDRPMQPINSRRPLAHRSPQQQQQQPTGMAGAPYSDPGHSHSPGLHPLDPQYLCGPHSLGPAYGSEYGGDSSSLYSESSYGQTPRRVLLDPETGKYFYIEVPMQPLRKMLFDPETGQYVEVLIPQQAMSHSGLYPPTAAPYPSLHNPNVYASAPQYMSYGPPPPTTHSQTQPQPPRYPEASAAAPMQPNGPSVSYRNSSSQGSKSEPPHHPPMEQGFLESMYYVPTGMNASPNLTPPVYYHKHPPNLPPTGGKRS